MRKLLPIAALSVLCLFFNMQNVIAQTVVYANDFPGVGGLSPFPGGTPILTFTESSGSSDVLAGSSAGIQIGGPVGTMVLTDDQLGSWTTVAHTLGTTNNGYAYTTAPLAGYASPFNATLSSNLELITWTFNMRTSAPATGFGPGQNNAAVILTATDPNVRSAGDGYAVIFNPATSIGMRFIKYTGGLTGTVTPLISSGLVLGAATDYVSIKVIYEPLIDQWTMYVRDDGAGGFADPSTGVVVAVGSAVDATYTGTPATTFGFYSNYSVTYTGVGPDGQSAYFDNFSATMSCPEIEGGTNTCVGLTTALTNPVPGGVWTTEFPGIADVDGVTGVVSGIAPGTSHITYTVGTCEVTTIVTVNPPPVPPAVTGTFSICNATTTTFSVTPSTAGSTWSSSNPAVGTVDPVTGDVSGITAGSTIISYTVPTGCFSTAILTVNPVAPISGFPLMCQNDTFGFINSVPGGTWSSGDLSIATVDTSTGNVAALSAGTAYITYTTPAGCISTVIVTVNPSPTAITGTPTVCEGMGSPLSSGPAGGFWSSSNETVASVSDAGLLVGNSPGTSLITYKLPTGCLTTLQITVNAQPLGIGGTIILCAEDTTILTNALAGGSWSSFVPAVGTIDPTTGRFEAISAGTTSITYMMPTGCFRTVTVTVNATPSPITGVPSVCVGLTTALTSSAGGTWQSSNPAIGSVNSATGIVTGITASTVTISYSYATGCRRTVVVTVTPLPPAIGGTTTVCTGRTSALTNSSAGGTWSSSDAAVGTINASTGLFTALTVGTSSIVYTIGTGCTTSVIVTVIASPAGILGVPVVCVGQTTALLNGTPGGTWSSSNTVVADVDIATGVVTGNAGGTATVSYTAPNGCFATVNVTVNSLPAAIGGTASTCINATTTLSSSPAGGTWSSSTPAVGTVNGGGVVTGLSAGTTVITYTRLGCYNTRVVTVHALPTSFNPPATNSVCLGLTITFTSTPGGGTWSSSNSTNAPVVSTTGVVTGSSTGTATISYTEPSFGCVRTRNITVNPLPVAIVGPTNLCPATTVALTDASSGGTWSSSTPGVATIGTSSGIVTGVITGTTRITYTLATGCITTTVVTVSTAPTAIITPIGDTVLCPGDFVTLTSTTTPGVTYQWYNGATLIGGATAPTYIASTSGNYQIRVSVAAGCTTNSAPMSVAVVPATATITIPGGSTSTCAGTPLTLNANTGAGLTYQWELAGSPIAGATTSTYGALIGGNYTVRVTNSAGCWAISAPVTVTIAPAPSNVVTVSGPLTFCNGSNVTFTASAGAGFTYQWYNASGPIPGATGMSYTATTAQTYYAMVTNTLGCVTTTASSIVVVNPLPNVAIAPGGPTIFCTGGIVSLTAAGGFTYQWYRDGAPIAGANSVAYIAAIGGGYRVRVTNAVTGCSDITHADTVVTVIASPSVMALTPAKFCWGGSSLLSTSVSSLGSAISYQWSFNSVVIPGATNGSYNATAAGIYECTISVPSSCTVATGPISVSQVPLPDPPIVYTGTSLRTGNYYLSYQWYKNLVMIPGATAFSTPATGNGSYKVAVTDTNGCQNMSAAYVLNNGSSTGVTDLNNAEIRIFPNPAEETVFIDCAVPVHAVVTGVDGKVLIDKANARELNIEGLADGLYIITLFDEGGQQLKMEKLVKRQ
jgi:trimeric autotransporter adhesin